MGDSDLFSRLSQSLIQPCSQNQALLCKRKKDRRVIPGPAGMVQAAMRPPETQLIHVVGGGCDDNDDSADADFFLNPWLSALEYLGIGRNYLVNQTSSGIISIKTHRTAHRAHQVVGIVISCRPNTAGGLFIVLKDPTGSIAASVHHKVLAENRELGVGCVVILRQVVVFPIRASTYLNITPNNIVKLFSKDCGLLPQAPPITRPIAYGKENEEEDNMRTIGKSVEMASANFPDVSKVREVTKSRTSSSEVSLPKIQMPKVLSASVVAEWTDAEINEVFSDYLDDGDLNLTPNKTVKQLFSKDCKLPSQASPISTPIPYGKANEEDNTRNIANHVRIASDKYPEVSSNGMEVTDAGTNSNEVILPKMQFPKVHSASVTEWSDAQINELFSDYPDDSNELEKFLL